MDKFIELTKAFLVSKVAKRFYWGLLNVMMGFVMSYLSYLASNNVTFATMVLVIATPLSQTLTKYLNSK